MNLLTIVIFVLIIILLYVVYKYMTKSTSTIATFLDASKMISQNVSKYEVNKSNFYAYSLWMYIDDWSFNVGDNKDKNVLSRVTSNNTPLFSLTLDKYMNNLNMIVNSDPSSKVTPTPCIVSNIPLQRWVNVIISVYQQTIDIYVDGKLVRTCVLEYMPANLNTSDVLNIAGGYSGYIAAVEYKPNFMDPQQAWDIYSAGYGGSNVFNRYKLKFAFVKDDQEKASFEI